MELRDYLAVLRKRWMTVVALTLLSVAAAAAATLAATPLYTATTRMFFAVQGSETISELTQGSYFAAGQMTSFAEVATSPLVLEPVRERLGLDEDASVSVSASVPLNTVILEISATDADPELAAAIANAAAAELVVSVNDLQPTRSDGVETVKATVLKPAETPGAPSTPKTKQNLALGLLVGLALGVGVAIIRETLDTKIRGESDLTGFTDHSVIGAIAFDPSAADHPVVMEDDPHGLRAEAIRRLRTNLQFVQVSGGPSTIVVTSSVPGEGKTTTTVNLAVALSDAGARVLLVDADLRRPSVARVLGLEGAVGLTTVLIGRATAEDVIQTWGRSGLDVLPAGQVPPNPSELLGSKSMSNLLGNLAPRYDVVLLDTAPLLPVTDAAVLSKVAGGALVIVGADKTHKAQLSEALRTLADVEANVLGLVLNKVALGEIGTYGYGYSYRSNDRTKTSGRATERPTRQLRRASGQAAPPATTGSEAPAGTPEASEPTALPFTWPGQRLSESELRR